MTLGSGLCNCTQLNSADPFNYSSHPLERFHEVLPSAGEVQNNWSLLDPSGLQMDAFRYQGP